jgi:hypothetical protein
MYRIAWVVPLLTVAAFAAPLCAQQAQPAAAAAVFYSTYLRLKPAGVPDANQRTQMRALISPMLDGLLAAADEAEARYANKTHKQVPPLVEGDLFTSLFEGATRISAAACAGGDKAATCRVDLAYRDGANGPETTWQDRVLLVRAAGGWVVDDIEYGGNWPFARRGRLSEMLKAVVREADR